MLTLTLLLLVLALIMFVLAAIKGDSQLGYVGLAFWVLSEIISRVRL